MSLKSGYRLMWPILILIQSSLLLVSPTESEEYDEIAKFNEVIQIENPLAVIFTEECCKCVDCVEAEVLLGGMSKDLEDNLGIFVVRLKKPDLRSRYGVKKVPTLVYIRKNKTAIYDGAFELESVYSWLQENIEPLTVDLDDQSFEHLTQAATGATTGDWLVIFHDGSCCRNGELLHIENAGIKLRNKVNVASVNVETAPETAERFRIRQCPAIIFFRHQKMYRFSLPDVTTTTLIRFAEGFYKNSKTETVPLPQSLFDKFTDKIVEKSRQLYNEHCYAVLAVLALTTLGTTILLVCTIFKPTPRVKKE